MHCPWPCIANAIQGCTLREKVTWGAYVSFWRRGSVPQACRCLPLSPAAAILGGEHSGFLFFFFSKNLSRRIAQEKPEVCNVCVGEGEGRELLRNSKTTQMLDVSTAPAGGRTEARRLPEPSFRVFLCAVLLLLTIQHHGLAQEGVAESDHFGRQRVSARAAWLACGTVRMRSRRKQAVCLRACID